MKNLSSIRDFAKRHKKYKRYRNKSNKYSLIGKFAKFLLMVEHYGLFSSFSQIWSIFLNTFFKSKSRNSQADIGIADTYLNPNEYFFNLNEFFDLLNKNDLKVDHVVDGISKNLNDIGVGNLSIKQEIVDMDDKWKWRLIELFDDPRGIGVLCSKKKP